MPGLLAKKGSFAMKKHLRNVAAVVVLFLTGCLHEGAAKAGTPSGTLLEIQSAGWNSISRKTNATVLREIGRLPSSKIVFGLLLDKLAGTPARIWKDQIPHSA